jgi:hypothetical protein
MPDLDGCDLRAPLKVRLPALDVILMTGSVEDLDGKLVRAIRSPAWGIAARKRRYHRAALNAHQISAIAGYERLIAIGNRDRTSRMEQFLGAGSCAGGKSIPRDHSSRARSKQG